MNNRNTEHRALKRAIVTFSPVLLLLILLILLPACGGEDATPAPTATPLSNPTSTAVPTATSTSVPATPTAAPTAVPSPTPSPTPTVTQELRANLGAEPNTLDPQLASALHEFSVIRQVFDGLLGFNPDLSLKPVVAAEVPTVENGGISEDGLVYKFKLREGVTWSDGEAVTADDFVYAIKRLFDPTLGAPMSFLYFDVKGGMEYATAVEADDATRQALREAVDVVAEDDLTLRVTLAGPSPTFLQKMALIQVYPVRQDIVEGAGAQWTEAGNYIGNGAYLMTEWAHQDHITLESNPDYWGPKPELTTITLRMVTDPNSELSAYRNDELELSRVPPGVEEAITSDPSSAREVIRSPMLFTFGLFFNTGAPPFNDVLTRRAFATAMDRESWIEKVKNGVGRPATGWLPPGMPGFDPDVGSQYAFDPDRARELLALAGYPDGKGFPSISYSFVDAGEQGLIAEFLQAQFKDNLGVEVSLDPLDPPSYFQKVMGAQDFELTGIGWGADYPDPENFLAPLFMTGAGNNIIQYSNPQFDEPAGLAFSELDQAERIELWKSAHEILISDVPVAPFFYGERFFLKKPDVQGLTVTAIDGALPGDTELGRVFLSPQ